MPLDHFENPESENLFFEKRFVYEQLPSYPVKRPDDKRVASLAGIREPGGRKKASESEEEQSRQLTTQELADKAKWEKEEAERKRKEEEKRKAEETARRDLERLSKKVDQARGSAQETPQETQKGLRKTRERVEKDLDLSKEGLKLYIDSVKAAIEKLDPDKLKAFINAHKEYSGGDHIKWNSDLCKTFGLALKDGEKKELEERRYAAALQIFLGDLLVKNGDIFQANRGKRANPFIYIDGYLGGYTISVLAAYWNSKYSKQKKESLTYAGLKEEYANDRRNRKVFNDAIDYLKKRLGGKTESPPVAQPPAAPAAVLPQAKGQGAPAGLPPADAARNESPPAPSAAPKQTGLEKKQAEQSHKIIEARMPFGDYYKRHYERLKKELVSEMRSFAKGGPSEEMDIDVIDDEYTRKGSVPRQMFTYYEMIYNYWSAQNSKYERSIRGNQLLTPAQKEAEKKKVYELKKLRDEALKDLEDSINLYFAEFEKAWNKMREEAVKDIAKAALKYDFPEGFELQEEYKQYISGEKIMGPKIKELMAKVPKVRHQPLNSVLLLKHNFKPIPTRIFRSNDDLMRYEGLTKENKMWLGVNFNKILAGKPLFELINTMIYVNNIAEFSMDKEKIISKRSYEARHKLLADFDKAEIGKARKKWAAKISQLRDFEVRI